MGSEELLNAVEEEGPFTNPWPAVVTALAATGVAFLLSTFLTGGGLAFCGVLTFVGLLAGAGAVWIRPRSAGVLGLAALAALLASFVADAGEWDSIAVLLRILAIFSGVSALAVLLPQGLRRVVVSLIILWHFGGILSATTNIAPGPWWSAQIWTYVYRPYLQYMYMNNAYHYYSPNPGPASVLWFRIEYEPTKEVDKDGVERTFKHRRWVKIPEVDDDGVRVRPGRDHKRYWPAVEYTRHLSIAESINQGTTGPSELAQRLRNQHRSEIPFIPPRSEPQYHEPPTLAKHWLAGYVRHVAKYFPFEDRPELNVKGIKVYLVIHHILEPWEVAGGADPNDLSLYEPYYMGNYNPDGTLKSASEGGVTLEVNPKLPHEHEPLFGAVREVDRDPFLYWYIPIYRDLKPEFRNKPQAALTDENSELIRKYWDLQTGDAEGGEQP
jgi:hypothetical protein